MILHQPMSAGNFRAIPLKYPDDSISSFARSVQEINLDLVKRTLYFRLWQTENEICLDTIWRLLEDEKSVFQIDGFSNRNESIFSIVVLDCTAIEHDFNLSLLLQSDSCTHTIGFKYRAHVRFGPKGNLASTHEDKTENSDRMMAKILLRPPQEHL